MAFTKATQTNALHKVGFSLSVVAYKNIQSALRKDFLRLKVAVVGNVNLRYFHGFRVVVFSYFTTIFAKVQQCTKGKFLFLSEIFTS